MSMPQPCRDAYAAYSREWRRRNPERSKDIQLRSSRSPRRQASVRAWRDRNREHIRAVERRRLYGLEPAMWDALLERQGGACAICHREGSLVVDHDHATGDVRGLLCGPCNTALGRLGDSVEGVQRALDYLQGHAR